MSDLSNAPGVWVNPEDVTIPEGLPQPMLWRVLIMPVQPASMSKGTNGVSIALPAQVQDADSHLNYIGKVVALGPLAGKSEKFENPLWNERLEEEQKKSIPRWLWEIGVGDWVCYGRYAGQRIEYQGVKLVLVADDEVLAKIGGPEGYRLYV